MSDKSFMMSFHQEQFIRQPLIPGIDALVTFTLENLALAAGTNDITVGTTAIDTYTMITNISFIHAVAAATRTVLNPPGLTGGVYPVLGQNAPAIGVPYMFNPMLVWPENTAIVLTILGATLNADFHAVVMGYQFRID